MQPVSLRTPLEVERVPHLERATGDRPLRWSHEQPVAGNEAQLRIAQPAETIAATGYLEGTDARRLRESPIVRPRCISFGGAPRGDKNAA
jgi:hypothetical protein